MKKKIADPLLMIATILIIVGFQVYWIKDNYNREKRLLDSKAAIVFRTSIFELQAKKLKLPLMTKGNDTHTDLKMVLNDGQYEDSAFVKRTKEQVMGIADAIHKLSDTTSKADNHERKMMISINNATVMYQNDSLKAEGAASNKGRMVQILYGIDSLQDSVKHTEIVAAVHKAFEEQKLPVNFSITNIPTAQLKDSIEETGTRIDFEEMSQVTIGFAHPVTYKLELKNTFAYLFKKILSPLLFSLFLVAVTIFSFLLLYRNLNRQRRLTELKNEFIGNITHELKTPISTVGVAIEAIQNFNALHDAARTQEYLHIASNELQRLSLLVDKVLRLSMFEKKQIELNKENFDLRILTQEVLDSLRLQFEKNNATVNFEFLPNDYTINADKLHIASVVYNLVDNALKYSKENPVINVHLSKEKNILTLKVSDNGIGIAPEYKQKVFDKFFRVPTGNQHSVKGYGLGLSYVSEIIKKHMGYIYVESELGKGSTFIAKLPDKEADEIWFDDKRKIYKKTLGISKKKNGL